MGHVVLRLAFNNFGLFNRDLPAPLPDDFLQDVEHLILFIKL